MDMMLQEKTATFEVEGIEVGIIAYTKQDTLCIEHVIVYEGFQGKGYASMMMKKFTQALQKQQISFTCTCSYAVDWMKKQE